MSNLKKILILITLLFISRPLFANNSQYWQTFFVEGEVYKNLKLFLVQEMRFSNGMGELSDTQTDLGVLYKLTDWFRFGAVYRQVFEDRGYDVDETFFTWRQEKRLIVNWYFDLNTKYVNFSDRNQFEFRFMDWMGFNTRYRNKLTAEVPVELSKKVELYPYVANEIFFDINTEAINMNRFYVGNRFVFIERYELDLYYLLQSSKQTNGWSDFNALGCRVGVSF